MEVIEPLELHDRVLQAAKETIALYTELYTSDSLDSSTT